LWQVEGALDRQLADDVSRERRRDRSDRRPGRGRAPAGRGHQRYKGPFEAFEFDIPPPEEGAVARRVAAQSVGWIQR
jgi:hypothetical protein